MYDGTDILSVESVIINIHVLYMMTGIMTQTDVYECSNAVLTLCLVTFMTASQWRIQDV